MPGTSLEIPRANIHHRANQQHMQCRGNRVSLPVLLPFCSENFWPPRFARSALWSNHVLLHYLCWRSRSLLQFEFRFHPFLPPCSPRCCNHPGTDPNFADLLPLDEHTPPVLWARFTSTVVPFPCFFPSIPRALTSSFLHLSTLQHVHN